MARELTMEQFNEFEDKMAYSLGMIGSVTDSLQSQTFYAAYAYQTLRAAAIMINAAYTIIKGEEQSEDLEELIRI